jgi:hypothetical protein
MRGAGLLAALAFLLCALAVGAAAHQAEQLTQESVFRSDPDGAIVSRASGYRFPAALAELPRRRVRIIAANDVMVQFTQRGGGLGDCWLDLIVYPATRPVDAEARQVEAELVRNMAATPVLAPAPVPRGAGDGRSGWFHGTLEGRSFTSGYVLVRRGDWFILVRASNPDEAGEAGMARLLPAIAAIDWTWRPTPDGNRRADRLGQVPERVSRRDPHISTEYRASASARPMNQA